MEEKAEKSKQRSGAKRRAEREEPITWRKEEKSGAKRKHSGEQSAKQSEEWAEAGEPCGGPGKRAAKGQGEVGAGRRPVKETNQPSKAQSPRLQPAR